MRPKPCTPIRPLVLAWMAAAVLAPAFAFVTVLVLKHV